MPREERTSTRRPGQLPPGRHKLPRDVVAESQRSRILDGVIQAVAEHGYQETRLAEVIAAAGLSRKTFYEYYKDLEDAFLAAYDMHVAALTEATSGAFLGPGGGPKRSWPQQIRDGVRAFLGYLQDYPEAAKVCMVDALGAGGAARGRRDAALRSFTFFVDSGRGEAEHEVPGRVALAVLGAANELIASELLYGSAARLDQLAPEIVYLIVLPFIGPKKALQERERTLAEQQRGRVANGEAAPAGEMAARERPGPRKASSAKKASGGKKRSGAGAKKAPAKQAARKRSR